MISATFLVQISRFRMMGPKEGELTAIFTLQARVTDIHDDNMEEWHELGVDQIGHEPAIRSKEHEREHWSWSAPTH